jgi:sugar lactone lactonase YvrE
VRQAGGITVSNGLAFSPDGRTLYWSDTTSHTVHAFDFDPLEGALSRQRVFAQLPAPHGRASRWPTTAAAPTAPRWTPEGCYWVAMFEGARLLRLSPDGEVLARAAPARALPHHAVLRRGRPAHPVHHHRAREPARRGARARALGRPRAELPRAPCPACP